MASSDEMDVKAIADDLLTDPIKGAVISIERVDDKSERNGEEDAKAIVDDLLTAPADILIERADDKPGQSEEDAEAIVEDLMAIPAETEVIPIERVDDKPESKEVLVEEKQQLAAKENPKAGKKRRQKQKKSQKLANVSKQADLLLAPAGNVSSDHQLDATIMLNKSINQDESSFETAIAGTASHSSSLSHSEFIGQSNQDKSARGVAGIAFDLSSSSHDEFADQSSQNGVAPEVVDIASDSSSSSQNEVVQEFAVVDLDSSSSSHGEFADQSSQEIAKTASHLSSPSHSEFNGQSSQPKVAQEIVKTLSSSHHSEFGSQSNQSKVAQELVEKAVQKENVDAKESSLDKFKWIRTEPPNPMKAPSHVIQSFSPRIKPRNYDSLVDSTIHLIEPTEYLIGYSNKLTAIGMIKHQNCIRDQPLTMQFGNWKFMDGRHLFVGSTVIVKSFARMRNWNDNQLKEFATKNSTFPDLMNYGSIYSNVQAVDWAIVKTPEIIPSLGRVKSMWTDPRLDNRLRITGIVHDYEYKVDVKILDDFWPLYVKEVPDVNSPVIIQWIKMDEPYTIYTGRNELKIVFPEYAQLYLTVQKGMEDYLIGWVDTKFVSD